MKKALLLLASHVCVLAAGFALGIYALPILTAPPAPTHAQAASAASQAAYTGHFRRDLKDSDVFHWGEGTVSVGRESIVLVGKLAPGPDYKLYLSPAFVETETDFVRLKSRMKRVGEVRTFENFVVAVPESINVSQYKAYMAANAEPFKKYGARFLARGGKFENPEGSSRTRHVVIEFPSYQAAVDCWHSPEYQRAAKLRQPVSVIDLVIIEGYEGPQPT